LESHSQPSSNRDKHFRPGCHSPCQLVTGNCFSHNTAKPVWLNTVSVGTLDHIYAKFSQFPAWTERRRASEKRAILRKDGMQHETRRKSPVANHYF